MDALAPLYLPFKHHPWSRQPLSERSDFAKTAIQKFSDVSGAGVRLGLHPGVAAALMAALLFGSGTPLAKQLLAQVHPWMLAALLYLGSGIGLWLSRGLRRSAAVHLSRSDWGWLLAAIGSGGVIAPVLLMYGLAKMPASGAALLLNAEGVFTALLAWFAFKENVNRRVALGMLAIIAGALVLTWPGKVRFSGIVPAMAVLGACFAWGIDNNLTRKVALSDASFIAMCKGLAAGLTNLILALALGVAWPSAGAIAGAAIVGFLSYGASLVLFVIALRHLGSARTGAYFSVAPFFGAVLAILILREALTLPLLVAGAFMALGIYLHLSERHMHRHTHEVMVHSHEHSHDDGHHSHSHDSLVPPGTRHSHQHRHEPLTHEHEHYPDAHHSHRH